MKYFLFFALLFGILPAFGQTGDQFKSNNAEREKKLLNNVEKTSRAIADEPNNPLHYLNRARLFVALQKNEAALQDVRSALSLAPTDNIVLMNVESIMQNSWKPVELVELSSALIAADKNNYKAYAMRARVRADHSKDYVGAIEDALAVVEINPTEYMEIGVFHTALYYLKKDRNILDRYDKIFEVFERQIKAVAANPPRVSESEERNRYMATVTLTKLRGNLQYFLTLCAAIYEEQGAIEKARQLLDKALKVQPDMNGYIRRAGYYKERGRYAEALADLNQAIKNEEEKEKLNSLEFEVVKGNSKTFRVNLLIVRGDLHAQLKEFDKAIADYELAISLYEKLPGKADVLKKIASAKQKMSEANQPE